MQEGTSQNLQEEQAQSLSVAILPEEVEAELQRILSSPTFRNAPRHCRFLSFVVWKALAGEAETVKEYLIGLEVFDRPSDYDPGTDPIVRAEARRLRSRLVDYYQTLGKLDQVRIDLPKGTYVPVFYRNGVEPPLEKGAPDTSCSNSLAYRAFPAANGVEESRWMVPEPRDGSENTAPPAVSRASGLTALKIVAAIATVGVAVFVLIRMLAVDDRPQSGRLEGSTLIISNASGQELWRKSFSDGFWPSYYAQGLAPRIWFGDLDGNGHFEVLLAYHPGLNPISRSATLICYADRGKEKWRWTPGRALPELGGSPATFDIRDFVVLKGWPKAHSRIVVSSSHVPFYPNQIAILDANGKMTSEYWHSGHLIHLTLADLDGDGREEIIATGISNGYHAATLVVLDPDRVFGASTEAARPEIQIHGMSVAQERVRLLFHRSDLNKVLETYNIGQEATVERGRIRFSVLECSMHPGCLIWYEFDRNFHLVSVEADDHFRSAHTEFYRNGKGPHHFSAEEEREFQKIRCLVGCKTEFVLGQNHIDARYGLNN
jgi:hypothetical protein